MATKNSPQEEIKDRVLKVLSTYDKINAEKVESSYTEWNGKLQQLILAQVSAGILMIWSLRIAIVMFKLSCF